MEAIFLLLVLGFPLVLGYAGYSEAVRKNRNKVAWGIICGIGGILPLAIIYLLKSKESPLKVEREDPLPPLGREENINYKSNSIQHSGDFTNRIKLIENHIIGFINDADARDIHNKISDFKTIAIPTIDQQKEISNYLDSIILKYRGLL